MSRDRGGRATALIVLLLAISCGIVFLGVGGSGEQQAAAITATSISVAPMPGFTCTIVTPPDGQTMVSPGTAVLVSFGHMFPDLSTLSSSTFYLTKAGSSTKVDATVGPSALVNPRFGIFPKVDLLPNTKYVATITSGVRSSSGRALSNPKSWSFTTGPACRVLAQAPSPGATGVPLTQTISVKFDADMDASTFEWDSFSLTNVDGDERVWGTISYDGATRTAFLAPSLALEKGKSYRVTLTRGVRSANHANPIGAPITWTFKTAQAATIAARSPVDGAANVPLHQEVSVVFDRGMDPASITTASFLIRKRGGDLLPASVVYDEGIHTAILTPMASLEEGMTYEVTLNPDVSGADGRPLENSPVTWSFRTSGGSATLSDVAASPYAPAIYDLVDRGIISGFPDGTFKPDDSVSRQQFAKMAVKALGYMVTGTEVCPFEDVPAQSGADPFYPSKYVAVCAAHGITSGKTPATFAPFDAISRQQLVTMLARAAALPNPPAGFAPSVTPGQFSSDEHYLNACKAEYAGLLRGLVGLGPSFYFLGPSTRAECAQLLYNLINRLSG